MELKPEKYTDAVERLPITGQQILAYQQQDQLVVYQAYNRQIAAYAVQHQKLGGSHYSYNRMSWIKPNFLWMMYRCGWASKEYQERVLAIWLTKADFELILQQAVFSSFNTAQYDNHEQWRKELNEKEVRLQWDPDHDPTGGKLARRAIQLGMKGSTLEQFGKQQIQKIEDITDFVSEQKLLVESGNLHQLHVPIESIYQFSEESLKKQIGVDYI